MESPFRGVEGDPDASQASFEGNFYLRERLAQRLSSVTSAEEEEDQEKVAKRLQLKHERARKKREIQLQRRRKSIADRLRKIREARRAVDTRFEEKREEIMERQEERHTSATRRRRISLENIKKARALHNRRVNQKRRESFDQSCDFSPAHNKGMDEIASKLAKAERNRELLRRERRRRSVERYEEGKMRALEIVGPVAGAGAGGGAGLRLRSMGEPAREQRRKRVNEARQEAKARQAQRMRSLRRRMPTRTSATDIDFKARAYAARLIQAWWRCMRSGKVFRVMELEIPPPLTEGGDGGSSGSIGSRLGSPSHNWAATEGLELGLGLGIERGMGAGEGRRRLAGGTDTQETDDPSMGSPKGSRGLGEREDRGRVAATEPFSPSSRSGPSHDAALAIQAFLRRNLHPLKVVNALLAARPSVKALCDAVRAMSTATFDEAIEIMSTRTTVARCEATLKALRMGREMRGVPQTVRTARAFLASLLVNFYPASSLDDEGTLPSSASNPSAPLQLEKDRLIRASGNAVSALLCLERVVDSAAAQAGGGGGGGGGGSSVAKVPPASLLSPEQFRQLRRVSGMMVRARVAFCQCFAEWKHKDAQRLADEMTAASVDILLMQLRARRDLQVAAVQYGLVDADDGGALFSTGMKEIKEGTQRQLAKMMHALEKLVGRVRARQRMDDAMAMALERLRADELEEDEAFLQEHPETEGQLLHKEGTNGLGEDDDGSLLFVGGATAGKTGADGSGGGVGSGGGAATAGSSATSSATAKEAAEQDDIAGPSRPLSAGDLLSNEWLV
ncbi:unnamed protein product, partial [Discosporangium mesarthrocarpum]